MCKVDAHRPAKSRDLRTDADQTPGHDARLRAGFYENVDYQLFIINCSLFIKKAVFPADWCLQPPGFLIGVLIRVCKLFIKPAS